MNADSSWLTGRAGDPTTASPDPDDKELTLALYRAMTLIRRFERATAAAYGRRQIHGTHRSSLGQEAIAVGVCHALRDGDFVSPGLRSVGDILARGGDPRRLMAELFGKETGLCGGRGGALHLADASRGVIGGFAVMTANVPMAMGLAIAARNAGGGAVVACFMGDRATNQGVFHETMNAAALQRLPVVYVGINNAPGDAATSLEEHTSAESMAALAEVHGIDSRIVDGTDVLAVHNAAQATMQRLRDGEGPAFLECRCFPLGEPSREQTRKWTEEMRRSGHYEGLLTLKKRDIGKADLTPPARWLEGDPILSLERRLLASTLADEAELERVQVEVEAIVQDAVRFAEESPEPPLESARSGVFAPSDGGDPG